MALKFFGQIKLLLWKNFSIRRRQWLRNAVEILWPLMLFLILVLVRKRRPAVFRPTSIYRPQALPSAGLVQFVRGFFCDFVDNGLQYNGNNSVDLPNVTILFDTIKEVQNYLDNQSLPQEPIVSSFVRNPENVQEFLIKNLSFPRNLAESFLQARVNTSKFGGTEAPFVSRLMPLVVFGVSQAQNRIILYDTLQTACNRSSWDEYIIFPSPENETAFKQAVCNLSRSQINELPIELRSQLTFPNGLLRLMQTINADGGLYEAICDKKMDPGLDQQDDEAQTLKPQEEKEKEEAQSKIKKNSCAWLKQKNEGKFQFRNYTDNRKCSKVDPKMRADCGWGGINKKDCERIGCCHDDTIADTYYCYCSTNDRCCMFRACLLDNIGSRVAGSGANNHFLQLMKTFMASKILYTPDNQHTRKIIEKANFTFSAMGYALEQIRMAAKNRNLQLPQTNPLDSVDSANSIMWRSFAWLLRGTEFSKNFETIRELIAEYGDCLSFDYFKPVKNEREAEKLALSETGFPPTASVVFQNIPDDAEELPPHVEYKIRQDIDAVQNPRWQRHRYWRPGPENSIWRMRYKFFGFIFLQDMIDRGITEVHANETIQNTGMFLQMFPYPCYIYDRFSYTISNSMPLFMTLAWIYSVGMIIKTIVHEKETRLKEVMKVMGLTNSVHWVAWFITSIVLMMITTVLLVLVLKFGDILQYSDPSVIFVFFFVFTISTIMFCFLISVFFSRANVAAACGGLIYLTTYLPYVILTIFEENVQRPHLIASCLLSPTAFGIACRYFARFEEQGIGLQWSNLYTSPADGDEFNVGGAMLMLIVDAVIYGLLTWYIEAVFPGTYGVPKRWYFPLTWSYWCSSRNKVHRSVGAHGSHDAQVYRVLGEQGVEMDAVTSPLTPTDANVAIEREPRHLPLGIAMRNLKKVYSNGKVAVDDLSLNLYSGQITSFLGHNGAGKTTTMSLLTGIYTPSEGTAFIDGKDIRTDMDEIRSSLGMCPQYNVLFDDLTVEEHLWFYAKLKGMESNRIPDEIEKFLANSHLIPKRKERSKFLSGGMKRKLSVSMAFVAGSKTVILDEPTAGVDPYARRAIWDLLLQYKEGRTILLSTHHMDEADVLGDRIAIIAQGKLCCCGTSLFLKSQYGSGYYLTLVKKDLVSNVRTRALEADSYTPRRDSDDDQSEISNRSIDEGVSLGDSSSEMGETVTDYDKPSQLSLAAFIKSYVAQAKLVESVGTEMTYVLPTGDSYGSKFENLFDALNQNLERFNISSFGVSDTTLEEVFLKVASDASIEEEEEVKSSYPTRRISVRNEKSKFERFKLMFQKKQRSVTFETEEEINDAPGEVVIEEDEEDIDDVFKAPRIQPKATGLLLVKKQFIGLLKKRLCYSKRNRKGFISQIILPALFVCLAMIAAMLGPPVGELPSLKLTTTEAIPQPNNLFFADARKSPTGKRLADAFVNPPGVGSHCIALNCSQKRLHFNKGYHTVPRTSRFLQSCSCKTGAAQCSDKCCKYPPPHAPSDTGDTVFNITLRDYTDYLLKTTKEFRKRRYGGVTFGHKYDFQNTVRGRQDPSIRRLVAGEVIKVWYTNKGYHAMPTFLSVATNTLLRERIASKGKNPRKYGITTYNHPMNLTKGELSEATLQSLARTDLVMAIFVIFALAFVPASFVVYLINERVSKAKHLHMVCGVNPLIYWISNFFWDMCNYCIPAFCCICIFLAFQERAYTSADNIGPTILLLLLYGWSITPLMYPASFFFEISSTAYIALICINLFVGMNTTIATFVLEFFDDDAELQLINSYLKKIFLIFPNYCLGRGLIDLAKNQIFADVYKRFGSDIFKDPLSWDITGRNILSMFVMGFVYFAFTLLIEYKFFIKKRKVIGQVLSTESGDDDVDNERNRVINGDADSECLRLVNLTKVYQSRFSRTKNVAVKQLCLGVPRGQCFGLLGVNGAGKTTTFKMLTGDIGVTEGDAYINQHSVVNDILAARQSMGYCPQFDALNDLLTAREHLQLYARIRGIQEEDVNQVADWCLRTLNLLQYADRCAGKYSGGNKRKLSTAIALVGECPIIFLDEPTTGMDPKARRFLWKVISDIVKDGRTIILTSHSMEECEALCGRIAIMVNGEFKCMGTPQHLKNKYGDGYTVILRVTGVMPDLEPVKTFMETTFIECVLKDQHHNMLEYQLHNEGTSLSFVFGELERNRESLKIEEYSVSQTTLDQVFINFAKQQTDGIEPVPPSSEVHSPTTEQPPTQPVDV